MNIVECRDVTKTYQQGKVTVHALNGVSLDITQGGFTALYGPSGSGKTTLLNLIGGLDRPDSGMVRVNGDELGAMSQTKLAHMRLTKVGFIFQSYNLIPVLTALENVEFVMQLQGAPESERRPKARAILDEVGLEGMHNRKPSELSGGQQQRVAVARAIVADPVIVLADEPTANLDSKTGQGLLDMMQHLNQAKGVTFIFSTHDHMVMEYSRRLVRLKDGRVEADEVRETAAEVPA
ncbi:MAG: ABC transporter ATP-binding protein [Desulfovibrio sp.]|nr:MAG: ABC transporter ATP-binding protein [Desulfovibrio sp.]